MPSASLWKLRRLAGRTVRVIDRRKISSTAIAAYERTTVPEARAFMQAYDEAARYGGTFRKEMAEGRNAVGVLLRKMQAWVPLVARDVSGFLAAEFGDQPSVPDDVIDDADRFHVIVDLHRNAAGEPLAYRDAALAEIGPAMEAAAREWSEAETADKRYQDLLQTVRAAAAAFDTDLKALRRTLCAIASRNDKDFQKLRAARAGAADEEDDPAAPPAGTITPAGPGTPPPV
jgi:hypothetical protein